MQVFYGMLLNFGSMKISALLFLLTIIPLFMDARQITLTAAEVYAEQLVNKEILNEQGKDETK